MQKSIKKWNYKTHKYEPFLVPADRDCRLLVDDFKEIIDCANCGKEVVAGDTYTSMTIHNSWGLGYCVCEECYEEEWKERKKYDLSLQKEYNSLRGKQR